MDRNSLLGLVLIGAILIGYSYLTVPTAEQLAAQQKTQDSLALVEKNKKAVVSTEKAVIKAADTNSVVADTLADSLATQELTNKYGVFASAAAVDTSVYTLENKLIKVKISSKGGRVKSVELKNYKNYEGKPVTLFEGDSSELALNFFANNRSVSTRDLYFAGIKSSNTIAMRLYAGSQDKYIEFLYSLKEDDYKLGYKVNFVGLNDVIARNTNYVELSWKQLLKNQEKDMSMERANSTIYFMFTDNEVDYISETENEAKDLTTKVKWVAMKQHFFTQVLIADTEFEKPTRIETKNGEEGDSYVKATKSSFTLPYMHNAQESFGMHFYFGPNHYQILKSQGHNLEKQIPLGWGIFGWVNRFIVIPIFNFLNGFNWSYGIIILILTIAIKLLLLPLTFKAYLSQAKMKVLKPEVDEIQGKFKEEPMKLQQEMMALYRKAGVSPLGGCLPMLLQMPILIAMFRFFPQSIELRQQSFLWATDLSTYDSILDLSFTIPFYGDHVSLFTLLMTISTLLITKVNSSSQMANPQMKWMMYLMPIIFLGVFNSYSAGLSYYYFLANMISIGQQYLFKSFVNEDEIHRKIQENKKKPTKKSKFQQRLEKMAKEKGMQLPK
ncbi:MAG: rane protein insertase YidC [Bacteroidota bacterium]|jgi:YidC/Oxa1 family membrane protein insertase